MAELKSLHDMRAYVWGMFLVRGAGLAAVLVECFGGEHPPATSGRGLATLIAIILAGGFWLVWMFAGDSRRVSMVGISGMGVAGGVLAAVKPDTPAIAIGAVAAMVAGTVGSVEFSVGVAVAGIVALSVTTLIVGGSTGILLLYIGLYIVGLGAGFARLSIVQRADQAEQLLEQTKLTQAAEARAAALAERTRIAREIHDILAHSLGALTMQVEAAQAQLTAPGAPNQDPHVSKALACIERAGTLARSGLAETRRAVLALREDTGLLPDMLAELVKRSEDHGRDGAVRVYTSGTARRLPPDATVALFRTAQEALTNAAKHAPGREVRIDLDFGKDEVTLTATNDLPEEGRERPLTGTGAGYGLTGLRERAELAGGTLTAETVDNTWRVCVRIPG